jgi:hypothetical protein
MSRAGKFIPGGARKSGPLGGGPKTTGPIRAPGDIAPDEPKSDRKLFAKGGLRKPVPKKQRLPITVMSGIVCCLIVSVAWYILAVIPARKQLEEANLRNLQEQQALAAEQAAEKKRQADELALANASRLTVKVDTRPSGASATIGDMHMLTPATFTGVPSGNHTISIHLDGYQDYQQTITGTPDKPIDLGVISLVQLTGDLSLTSPQSDVTYTLTDAAGNARQGTVPDKLSSLPVGTYQLVAKQHDWTLPPVMITLHPQENLQQAVKFPYASLTLESTPPGATVRNGHTVLGQTPLSLNNLHPGAMHLSIDLPPYTIQFVDVDLPDFGNVSKAVTLTRDRDFIAACGMPMVWISEGGFWAGKYEVTQAQFEPVAQYNPSFFRKPERPVESISWENAMAFCDKLNEYERKAGRLPTGYHYTLPTESQWSLFSANADINQAPMSRAYSLSSTQDVGASEPNKYGLYDTLGNVWEWCLDSVDEQGDHSLRGGSWLSSSDNFPSADTRVTATPKNADKFTGFRVVLVPNNP